MRDAIVREAKGTGLLGTSAAGLGTLDLNLVTRKPVQSFEQRKDLICFCFSEVTMTAWGVLPGSRDQFDATEVSWTTEYASSA